MKITLLSLLLLVSFLTSSQAGIIGPDDLPTISALIELHKKMAKAEDVAVKQVGTLRGISPRPTIMSASECHC